METTYRPPEDEIESSIRCVRGRERRIGGVLSNGDGEMNEKAMPG